LPNGVNIPNIKGQKGKDTPLKNGVAATGALVIPCLVPELNSFFQFFMPGAAAAFLNSGSIRRGFMVLLAVYILGSTLFLATGMVASALILAQASVICGGLLIAAWKAIEAPKTLLVLTLSVICMSAIIMVVASGLEIQEVYSKMISAMTNEYDKAVELYKKNVNEPLPVQLDQLIIDIKRTLIAYFPGIVSSFFIFLSLSNIITFSKLNQIKGLERNLKPEFDRWRLPWWLVWVFILFGFMAIIPEGIWPDIGKNGVLILCVFYLIQGFSIMRFFFKVMDTPIYIRYLVYALIGIQWYGLLLVVFTGLMDNWFDFRTRLEKKMASKEDNQS